MSWAYRLPWERKEEPKAAPKPKEAQPKEKSEEEISRELNAVIAKTAEKERRKQEMKYKKTLQLLGNNNIRYLKTQKRRLSRNYPFIEQAGYVGLYGNDYNALMENLRQLRKENKNSEKRKAKEEALTRMMKNLEDSLNDPTNTRYNYLLSAPFRNRKGTNASDPRPASPFGGKRTRKHRHGRKHTRKVKH